MTIDKIKPAVFSLAYKLQPLYDAYARPYIPTAPGIVEYAGIPVPINRKDPRAPRITDFSHDDSNYKMELLNAIRENVNEGDDVAIIGAGRGVSSVVALRQGATVTAYEAAAEMLPIAQQTVDWQGYTDEYQLVHGVVGDTIKVYGNELGGLIPPETITADLVIMDCEGAEKSIVSELPGDQKLIIESHPEWGAPSDETLTAMPQHATVSNLTQIRDTNKDIILAIV